MTLQRRAFITGLTSFLAAPAIVRASSIMPVRSFTPTVHVEVTLLESPDAYLYRLLQENLQRALRTTVPIHYNKAGFKQIENAYRSIRANFDYSSGRDIKCVVVYKR